MKPSLFFSATAIIAICLLSGITTAYAQNKVVVVPLFDSSPRGVEAIPFYCSEAITSPGDLEQPSCFRSDTRTSVTPVPEGHFMFITDVHFNKNSTDNAGEAFVYVGRNDDVTIPATPRINFSLSDLNSINHLTWSTPRIILREGERPAIYNSSSSTRVVDAFMTGYLVKTDGF